WAPKAIATIRELVDTLEDRSIIITLQRKPKTAAVERLRKRDSEEFATLRRKAARWAADNLDKLTDPEPAIPDALNDRAADNWRPLLAIADLAGGEWPQLARQACLTLSGESAEEAMGVMLLADCRRAFGDDDAIRSADLVTKLATDPERPWAEYNRGHPITQRQVAKLLGGRGGFGIFSVNVRPKVGPQGKGYRRIDFEEAWASYCPDQTSSRTDSTFLSVPPSQGPWNGHKLMVLHASQKRLGTDRKMASCTTTMRVGTLGRIENMEMVQAIPARQRPLKRPLAFRTSSTGTAAITAVVRSESRSPMTGLVARTASG